MRLLESSEDSVVGWLGVVVGIEEKRLTLGPPGVVVADTPDSDTNAVLLVQASLGDIGPVRGLSVLNVNFGERTLRGRSTKRGHGIRNVGTLAGRNVALRTDTVNGDASSNPLLNVADHTLGLGVRG